MIKLIGVGIWVVIATLGSVYFSISMATKKENTEPTPAMFGGLETIRGEVTSIPVISGGAVQGYFLTRLSYTLKPDRAEALTIPVPQLVTDELYTALVGSNLIDFPNMHEFDLNGFREAVRTAINTRIGEEVFQDIIIEQIDFLSKEDIRSNMRQGRFTMKEGAPVGDKKAPAKKDDGHGAGH